MKIIHRAVVYFGKIREIFRPQIREELFNYGFDFYKKRERELKSAGEECREGLLVRMLVTQFKKFVECERIMSEFGVSLSGSKALQAGIDSEIRTKMREYAEDEPMSTWNKPCLLGDLRMVIDKLPSIDSFILNLLLEPLSASEIVLILEANDIKNARMLIKKAIFHLKKKLNSTISPPFHTAPLETH